MQNTILNQEKSCNLSESLRLYAVSDCGGAIEDIKSSIESGVTFFQLREKTLSFDDFCRKACAVREFCPSSVPFVINDNLDVALACNADGLHIGQSDGSVREARIKLGRDKILGVSATTVAEAIQAEADGADYLGVGAVFPTSTKADAAEVSYNTLRAICLSVKIPVVAIGGISASNLNTLAGSGIKGVALVSAIYGQKDIPAAVNKLDSLTKAMVAQPLRGRRAAIVDLDGVVLDSLGTWQEIDRRYLEAHRLSGRPDIVNRLNNSTTLLDAAVYLHQECGIEKSPEGICEEFETLLGDFYRYELKLMDGALEALTKLKEKGFSLALATASSCELAHAALRRNGAENFFDHFFCNADKMETTTFYNAIEALGTGIGETVVFDDLPKIQAKAASLGFRVYGALTELE